MTPPLSAPHDDDGSSFEIPRFPRQQVEELARMFGEPPQAPESSPEPTRSSSRRRARRRDGGVGVTFKLLHMRRASRKQLRKMSDKEFAEYERARTDAQKYVGEHFRHFDRPLAEWTADDLNSLLADMLATVRACPARKSGRVYVAMNRSNGRDCRQHGLHIYISHEGTEFRADATLDDAPIPERAFSDWIASLQPYLLIADERKQGVAITVNEYKSALWIPGRPDPDPNGGHTFGGRSNKLPPIDVDRPLDAEDDQEAEDDEPDLDDIERAARRALHGRGARPDRKSLPPRPIPPPPTNHAETFDALMFCMARLDERNMMRLARVALGLFRDSQ